MICDGVISDLVIVQIGLNLTVMIATPKSKIIDQKSSISVTQFLHLPTDQPF